MSNTLNSTLTEATAPITPVAIFTDSELIACRRVEFMGSQYYLKPQAFKVVTGEDDPNRPNAIAKPRLILKTTIWLLQRPQFLDIAAVVGHVHDFFNLKHSDPEYWDALSFTDSAKSAVDYYTDAGFNVAQDHINTLTDQRIVKGLQLYLGEGKTERQHVLKMCLFNLMTKRSICVYETDPVSLYEPPPLYKFDGVMYQLKRQSHDDRATYCEYYPQGSFFNV